MTDHHHKNVKHNLVPLCKACHLKVTNHEMIVTGWKDTSKGLILSGRWLKRNYHQKRKFSDARLLLSLNWVK